MRFAIIAAIVGISAIPAAAQQFDRRARDEPEVVVAAGGRVGNCDVLRFTPSGDHLLAAGDDKVVWVWPHTDKGLDTDPKNVRTLHWRSWRDQLGGIKAMAVSPDGKRVAIGGYGLRISSVAVLDRETGETLAITWPNTYEGGENFDAVKAVAFDEAGERIAFGTADGSLWLWKLAKLVPPVDGRTWSAPVRAGRFEIEPELLRHEKVRPVFNFPRSIRFAGANTIVGVSEFGQVLECDLSSKLSDDPRTAAPAGKTLFNVNPAEKGRFHIKFAEWTADGKWLAVATTGNLAMMRSADGRRVVPIRLGEDEFIRGIAIDATGKRLAVGVGRALKGKRPRFFMDGNDRVLAYEDLTAEELPKPREFAHTGRAEALAFHPKLDRLAVAGGDADEVTLLDLSNAEKPVSVVRGRGRHLHEVNLSEDGNVIGVRVGRNADSLDPNRRAAGEWTRFNLPRFTPTADANVKWVQALERPGGWSVVPDDKSRYVWFVERKRGDGSTERIRLGLDQFTDLAPTCYRFVPTGEGKPPRLLVGHYYGCSLFELDPGRVKTNPRTGAEELPRSKLFIGHGAEVNSIVADRRGEWFVTAASDQTVAGWSLADWKAQAALGAAFEVKNGELVVAAVDAGSPAWEAGLTQGDIISGLAVDGKRVYNRQPKREPVGTPEEAARVLENPQSGIELFFAWTAGKSARATPTRIKQRPLWKWFPAFDERGRMTDSILWMWHGSYYYTASLHGDRMVGWHVNHPDVNGTAEFHALERYKHLFLKPGVIAKLIGTRSAAEALREAGGGNILRRSFREFEPEPVDLALGQAEVRGDSVKVKLAVNALGNNPDLQLDRIELWLNDHRLQDWNGKGKNSLTEEVEIPSWKFRAGDNQLTLLATNPARGRAETVRFIRNPNTADSPQLLGVSVGVNDYSAHRKADLVGVRSFGDLIRAADDAAAFQKSVLGYRGAGKHFPKGDLALMLDATVDRKTLMASFAELGQRQMRGGIKPDDLLVVFFAGHGDLLSDAGQALPVKADGRGFAADSGKFVFCCPNYSPAKADVTTFSGEELFEQLARMNCRKLVLIDACHAGGALETNLLRRCIPNNQGPVVIAACDESEKSFEDDKLRHGMFTYAVLEALGPRFRTANRALDGRLTAQELFAYVSERVPELMRQYRPGNTQNPICFPRPDALPRAVMFAK
jgi:WD40 repeat protein